MRGLDGLEAEWVTEKRFSNYDAVQDLAKMKFNKDARKLSDVETDILAMDGLERVMVSETLRKCPVTDSSH